MRLACYIILFLVIFSEAALSCPGCAGSTNNQADNYTVYVLMTFIGAIYIPFYFLFRTINKYKNLNRKQN